MSQPTSAMIFAAGFGTRMAPLTTEFPKPMVPVKGRPMIAWTIEMLRAAGIKTIVANTHYLHEKIEPFLIGENIRISREIPDILDTGGGLKNALPLLGPGPVITINPDAIWLGDNPIRQLMDGWRNNLSALLMVVSAKSAFGSTGIGDFSLENGQIHRMGPYVYGGAQIIRTDSLTQIPDKAFSLNLYWDHLSANGGIHGLVYDGAWCDTGHPEGVRIAEGLLEDV